MYRGLQGTQQIMLATANVAAIRNHSSQKQRLPSLRKLVINRQRTPRVKELAIMAAKLSSKLSKFLRFCY